jgi:coronin-1B/1C/6
MSNFVRQSKYRHVFVEAPKIDETFQDLRLSTATGEQSYIKGNTKFFAVALVGGGGPVAILEHTKPGRVDPTVPSLAGHKGATLDFDFNPFHEHIIATASDDTTLKIWGIPEGGLTETITEPLVDLKGHGRKVSMCKFHPTAANVLSSLSSDFTVKLWDIEKGAEISTFSGHKELIQDLCWDYTGRMYATSSKDKTVRFVDARTSEEAFKIDEAHEGAKSVKMTYLGAKDKLVTFGFNKQSQRQLKVWDPRAPAKPLSTTAIDQAAGVIMPFYDQDTDILYAVGKGDGNIRYYECVDEKPFVFPLSEYRSTVACKGMCFLPKRACNVMKCETAVALKLTGNAVEPLKFIVPRKSDAFQEDLYPPTFSGVPSQTAAEWLAGRDLPPKLCSLDPASAGAEVANSVTVAAAPAVKSKQAVQDELDAALARISLLEKALTAAGIAIPK